MKILHIDKNHPLLINELRSLGYSNDEDYNSDKKTIEKKIATYNGIVIRSRFKIDKDFIDAATSLKFIARVGAGLESIDCDYAEAKGIKLFSAPEGNRNAVGEHALGMLLGLMNKLKSANVTIQNGQWLREEHRGYELDGKTVGIIGYGHMGNAFARKLQGFDCNVICYDIKDNVGNDYAKQVPLEIIHREADVLSLHTPWTPLTDKMIDNEFINKFHKPFWFINTARGKSVITQDLVNALIKGKILGAGLDVLEYEKLSFESLFSNEIPEALQYLINSDNVLLSPHVAGWTVESKEKLAQTIVDKIKKQFETLKT